MIKRSRCIFLAAMSLSVFVGCAARETTYSTVMEGMSRNVLRANFGEPLRIEPQASGGEDWYYNFSSWQAQPTGSSGTTEDFGDRTSYASAGLAFSQRVLELPVHVSSAGFVVSPLPKGKVVKNDPLWPDAARTLKDGGAYRIRTCDPHNAIVVLYQLS